MVKRGRIWPNRAKRGQTGPNGAKGGQTGPNGAKRGNHPWVGEKPTMGWRVTLLGMVGDLDDHKISTVQNFWPVGAVEAYNS